MPLKQSSNFNATQIKISINKVILQEFNVYASTFTAQSKIQTVIVRNDQMVFNPFPNNKF